MRPRLTQLLGLLAFLTLHSLCLFADETVVTETLIAESPSPSPSPVESPAPIVSTTVPPVPEVSPAAVQEVPPSPAPVEEVPVVEPETVVTGETIPIEAVPSPEPAPVPERRRPVKEELLPPPNLFAEHFFLKPELKLKYKTWETNGFVFMETPNREQKSRYSLVTDFAASAMKSQILPGLETVEDVRKWVKDNVKSAVFEGVEVKRVPVPVPSGEEKFRYWVGQKSFATADEARAEIAMIKAISEKEGRDFNAMIQEAARYVSQPEEEPPVEIKTPAQFEKEEEIMLKFIDHLDIGNEMFGPFQGEGTGEPIVWQSFGETSWRMTNLDKKNFSDQVGFWTNRMVFKGLRAPLSTIDPFIEATAALETNGVDSASHLDLSVGLEWRPLGRNPWFLNFRPWSLPLLEFMRNFRFYFQYFDRKNLKDEVEESPDYELQAGVQIFYEWGVDLPPVGEGEPTTVPDYLRRYVWGE